MILNFRGIKKILFTKTINQNLLIFLEIKIYFNLRKLQTLNINISTYKIKLVIIIIIIFIYLYIVPSSLFHLLIFLYLYDITLYITLFTFLFIPFILLSQFTSLTPFFYSVENHFNTYRMYKKIYFHQRIPSYSSHRSL